MCAIICIYKITNNFGTFEKWRKFSLKQKNRNRILGVVLLMLAIYFGSTLFFNNPFKALQKTEQTDKSTITRH